MKYINIKYINIKSKSTQLNNLDNFDIALVGTEFFERFFFILPPNYVPILIFWHVK